MSKSISDVDVSIRATFDVFGEYQLGKLKGKVNPRESVRLTITRDSFKDCKGALNKMTDGAFFKVVSVETLSA